MWMCPWVCFHVEKHTLSHTADTNSYSPLTQLSAIPPQNNVPTHTLIFIFFFYYHCFIFCLLHSICQILVPRPGIEPTLHPLEGEVLLTGPPGKSLTLISLTVEQKMGFPGGSAGEESACNEGDLGLIPGLRRSPAEGKGYPLQYSGLEKSMDYRVHGVAKSQTWLNNVHFRSIKQLAWRNLLLG